jgi:hypothetical protein
VALVDGGAVICSAKRYDLSARIEGRIRRVLGIGAVFTPPARRGRGAAQRLLETLLETAEAEGFEYAMLFSEIDPAFYERLDFVPIPVLESRLEVKMKGGSPAVLVRAGDDRDIASVAEMSARRVEARDLRSTAPRIGSVMASRSAGCSPASGPRACATSSFS